MGDDTKPRKSVDHFAATGHPTEKHTEEIMMAQVWSILLVTALIGFCVALALVGWVRNSPVQRRNELSCGRPGAAPGPSVR